MARKSLSKEDTIHLVCNPSLIHNWRYSMSCQWTVGSSFPRKLFLSPANCLHEITCISLPSLQFYDFCFEQNNLLPKLYLLHLSHEGERLLLPALSPFSGQNPTVLHWAPSTRHRAVGEDPKEATKKVRRLEHFSFEERLRKLGSFSLKKALGDPTVAFQYLTGRTPTF